MTRRRVQRTVFLMTAEERELLESLAEHNGETVSSQLRQLIRRAAIDQLGWTPTVAKPKRARKAAR